MYADDCTIFLDPTDENLRNTVNILDIFFKISGLRISVNKTKAIWFGAGHHFGHKLCPDLPLNWDNKFKLLGIEFDNNLEKMDSNYSTKIEEITKLLNCWIYRNVTPYGKIVIIKTLALSKLSHTALVIPSLSNKRVKEIETLFFKFLWGNKPDKVSRECVKIKEKQGGMGLIDIKDFWMAFKFSWIRRLIKTDAFWPHILELNISQIINEEICIHDILTFGAVKFSTLAKKILNPFWKEVFVSVKTVIQGAICTSPEKLILSPLWDNPGIMRNNKTIPITDFSVLYPKVKSISDLFMAGTNIFCSRAEIKDKLGLDIDEETHLELRLIIHRAFAKVGIGITNIPSIHLPLQPLLVNIANQTRNGCSAYYKLIRSWKKSVNVLADREDRWHRELGRVYSIPFWSKTYRYVSCIKNDNKIKWM